MVLALKIAGPLDLGETAIRSGCMPGPDLMGTSSESNHLALSRLGGVETPRRTCRTPRPNYTFDYLPAETVILFEIVHLHRIQGGWPRRRGRPRAPAGRMPLQQRRAAVDVGFYCGAAGEIDPDFVGGKWSLCQAAD